MFSQSQNIKLCEKEPEQIFKYKKSDLGRMVLFIKYQIGLPSTTGIKKVNLFVI